MPTIFLNPYWRLNDLSERIMQILLQSFTKILIPGIKVTIPLTLASFALGFAIALFLALVQVARVPVLSKFARR